MRTRTYIFGFILSTIIGIGYKFIYQYYLLPVKINNKREFPEETWFSHEIDKFKTNFLLYPYSGTYKFIPQQYILTSKSFQGESSIYSIVAFGKFRYENAYTDAVKVLNYEDDYVKPDSITKNLLNKRESRL